MIRAVLLRTEKRPPCVKGAGFLQSKKTGGLLSADKEQSVGQKSMIFATADCQASATPQNTSKGDFQLRHFLGRVLIKYTTFSNSSSETS